MFKNYLKISLRYLLRYKTYTAINTLGLAVGITCCILIMLFVRSEFSYDRFHTKANRIYRISKTQLHASLWGRLCKAVFPRWKQCAAYTQQIH
jgi:hypothetical protein